MACLRLTSICVFLVFAGQALSQERARPHPPNITIVPVSPSLSIGEPSLHSLEEPSLRDLIENPSLPAAIGDRTTEILSSLSDHVAVSKIEEELALRCRLHGLDLYPAKRDGLAAIAARVTEYDRLVRTRDVSGSRYVVSTRSKLNDTCRDLIDSVRVRALQQSIRVKTESVAFNKASVEVQPTLDRPELIEEFFPWPPRWPTSRWPAAPDLFADRNRFQTLANVNDFLRQKLQEAGYGEYGYFKIKNTGFAIVTQLERINKKGEPDPAKRFDPSLKPTSSFNLAEYVYRFILGSHRSLPRICVPVHARVSRATAT